MTTQRSRLGLADLFWTSFTAEIHAMPAIELGSMIDAHETDEHPMLATCYALVNESFALDPCQSEFADYIYLVSAQRQQKHAFFQR